MNVLKELLEKRAKLMGEVAGATAERFKEIKDEIAKLDFQIEDEKRKVAENEKEEAVKNQKNAELASRNKNQKDNFVEKAILINTNADAERQKNLEKKEERGKALREGKTVKFETRAVSSSSAALATHASSELVPAFEQVGTLDTLVDVESLPGGESYKVAFEKTIGTGDITDEGENYADAEPTFDYADIDKVKITAYAEITEEMQKLPNADYDSRVYQAVVGAARRKVISQIFNGNGNKQFVGIFNAPSKIIANEAKVIATITENTLDDFIYAYGGDENVEGDAVLLMNKLTLAEFAKVKGADKKKAYDIVLRGNTGTINGITFVLTSRVKPFATALANEPYISYGKLKAYKLTYFSDYEVQKSTDYKFKQGMTAYKVSVMAGGSPVMYNGFLNVIKSKE